MQNGNVKIKDLFNGDRIFNIPKYQRAYAWEEEENLAYFLDDLKNQRSEKSYFLGTLLFHERKSRGEYEFVDVVDGQQRLTTIIIFMKVIISILIDQGSNKVSNKTYSRYIYDGYSYKLELENEDSSFLHNKIFGDTDAIEFETPSQKRLYLAKVYFYNELSSLNLADLENIFSILVEADVILYVVNKISDATQIFELLNDRGKRLTDLEGIKSFLMYRIGCLNLKDNEDQSIDAIQNNFASIYRKIEKYNINENDVLRYHTIAFEESKAHYYNNPEGFVKNKINAFFKESINDLEIKHEIMSYTERLRNGFDIFNIIKENSINLDHLNNLFMIGRVNPFYPLLMHTYKYNFSNFSEFSRDLTKFTFRSSLVGLKNDNEVFYKYIRNAENFSNLFKWIINDNWWDINKRADEVLNNRNHYVRINNNIIKYILFSYENYLRKIKGYPLITIETYFSDDKREKINIEHITAQRAKNINLTIEFEEKYLHSLGNLVIDTISSNSRKSNNPVDDKLQEYSKSPIMSQNEINDEKIDWDNIEEVKLFIDKRNEMLLSFIKIHLL
jgi:uncharacterized protein with ParB-like and HNH nuclease domain